MNKPIIIDGVDVAECYFYYKGECRCELNCIDYDKGETIEELFDRLEHNYMECQPSSNCYYKQMQRLKEENERLKAFKRECLKPVYLPDIDEPEVINKYKQALEDVREYVNSQVDGFGNDVYGITKQQVKDITDKINEVLK